MLAQATKASERNTASASSGHLFFGVTDTRWSNTVFAFISSPVRIRMSARGVSSPGLAIAREQVSARAYERQVGLDPFLPHVFK
jgi:hypothetical protein